MKTFSLYVPKFNRTLPQSDVTASICHLLKIPEHRLTYEAYREVRKHPKIQAMLDAPMFEVRWRWNATRSLAIQRNRAGKRIPPQFQRMDGLLEILY